VFFYFYYHHCVFNENQPTTTRQRICLTIGNPPFGKNSSTAIAFFNQAARFSSVIALILPQTFCKNSVLRRLDRNFVMMTQIQMENERFTYNNSAHHMNCVFQIWTHTKHFDLMTVIPRELRQFRDKLRPVFSRISESCDFTFLESSIGADIAIRRVGVNAGKIFNNNIEHCSKASHLFLKIKNVTQKRSTIRNLLSLRLEKLRIKYATAGCPSISKSELCSIYNKRYRK